MREESSRQKATRFIRIYRVQILGVFNLAEKKTSIFWEIFKINFGNIFPKFV